MCATTYIVLLSLASLYKSRHALPCADASVHACAAGWCPCTCTCLRS